MVNYDLGRTVGDWEKVMFSQSKYSPPSRFLKDVNGGFMFIPPEVMRNCSQTADISGPVYYPGCGRDLSCLWVFDRATDFVFQDGSDNFRDISDLLKGLEAAKIVSDLQINRNILSFVFGDVPRNISMFYGKGLRIKRKQDVVSRSYEALFVRGTEMVFPITLPALIDSNGRFVIAGYQDANEGANFLLDVAPDSVPHELIEDYILSKGFIGIPDTKDYVRK